MTQPFTILYMNAGRPPARPWYDLVTEASAIKGWSVTELARRAGVGRPTIYGWRDNLKKPQARPVNAVADSLGIDRARAVRLAGIISDGSEPEPAIPPDLMAVIRRTLSPADQEKAIAALNDTLSGTPAAAEEEQSDPSRRAG